MQPSTLIFLLVRYFEVFYASLYCVKCKSVSILANTVKSIYFTAQSTVWSGNTRIATTQNLEVVPHLPNGAAQLRGQFVSNVRSISDTCANHVLDATTSYRILLTSNMKDHNVISTWTARSCKTKTQPTRICGFMCLFMRQHVN